MQEEARDLDPDTAGSLYGHQGGHGEVALTCAGIGQDRADLDRGVDQVGVVGLHRREDRPIGRVLPVTIGPQGFMPGERIDVRPDQGLRIAAVVEVDVRAGPDQRVDGRLCRRRRDRLRRRGRGVRREICGRGRRARGNERRLRCLGDDDHSREGALGSGRCRRAGQLGLSAGQRCKDKPEERAELANSHVNLHQWSYLTAGARIRQGRPGNRTPASLAECRSRSAGIGCQSQTDFA